MELLSMNNAIVWGQKGCQFCDTAVAVLKARGVEVEERKIGEGKWTKFDFANAFPKARTIPQIVIDGVHIGGYRELVDELQ